LCMRGGGELVLLSSHKCLLVADERCGRLDDCLLVVIESLVGSSSCAFQPFCNVYGCPILSCFTIYFCLKSCVNCLLMLWVLFYYAEQVINVSIIILFHRFI